MKPNSFATTIGLILALAVFGGAAQGTDGSAAKASRDWQKIQRLSSWTQAKPCSRSATRMAIRSD